MYVAVKGGEKAIDNAHRWLAEVRRGDQAVPDLELNQIAEQLQLSVARVMAEGSLFDPELAALAIKQARGDMIEATFLIRAFRTTLPRFGATMPIDSRTFPADRSSAPPSITPIGYWISILSSRRFRNLRHGRRRTTWRSRMCSVFSVVTALCSMRLQARTRRRFRT